MFCVRVMSNLYKYKPLKFGFIILCPSLNIGHLKNTVSSTDICFPEAKVAIVLPANCKKEEFDDVSKLKKTYKGGKTVASMINTGVENAPCKDWNFLLFPKGWIKSRVDIKYSYFVENEKDILFPVINRNLNFIEADINGLFFHKKSFEDAGPFPDTESLDTSKLIWATKAIKAGYHFKGIIGGRVF